MKKKHNLKPFKCHKCLNVYPRTEEYFLKFKDKNREYRFRNVCINCSSNAMKANSFLYNHPEIDSKQYKKELLNKKYREVYKPKYRDKYKEHTKIYNLKYKTEHKNQNRIQKLIHHHERMKEDPTYRLKINLEKRMHILLKRNKISKRSLDLLGCSVQEARLWIEHKFKDGMSWYNWGQYGWHIDHIKPIASFDLTDYNQQKICFHYTNLQPLWWKDNRLKSNKII